MKMKLLKLFFICTFKDPNLTDKFKNLAENKKKLNSTEFMEFVFSKSDAGILTVLIFDSDICQWSPAACNGGYLTGSVTSPAGLAGQSNSLFL